MPCFCRGQAVAHFNFDARKWWLLQLQKLVGQFISPWMRDLMILCSSLQGSWPDGGMQCHLATRLVSVDT